MLGNKCCVKSCGALSFFSSEISFHSFPKNPDIKAQWIDFCSQPDNWVPTKYSKICAKHFQSYDFIIYYKKGFLGCTKTTRLRANGEH